MAAVSELASDVGTSAACRALDMPRASYYRRRVFAPKQTIMRSSPARALAPAEREMVLAQLHDERFQDRSPAAVYATLLDEGQYLCSIRTMYRVLEGKGKSRERRDQLTLQADRGTSMSSKPVAFLLADLGVTKTHSRPHVSDDNPYSESQFRTMKYRPEFPDRFGCIQDSRAFCQGFFRWDNEEHRHSSLALLTPAMVHYGQSALILEQRQTVLDRAYLTHPERFVRQTPRPAAVPTEVWINKPPNLENKTQ
jgi:hypothetical protein